jgi:hypothetical protein
MRTNSRVFIFVCGDRYRYEHLALPIRKKPVMKKLMSLLAVVLVALSLSACQSTSSAPIKEAPVSLNGSWKADGVEAVISTDSIKINLVSSDGAKSLYWKGTFPSGTDKITSVGDREALDITILGSPDKTKVFNVDGNKITFEISMMGTTKTVRLEKA